MAKQPVFPDQSHQIPLHISQQATDWYVRLQAEHVTEQELAEFQNWLKSDDLHQLAWQRLEDFGFSLQQIQHPLLQPVLSAIEQKNSNHLVKVLIWFTVFGSSTFGLYQANQQQLWQQLQADYKTKVGEQKTIELADGSKIILNTDTAINVSYNKQQRLIELIKGEIRLEVLPDTQHRPFYVQNRDGLMQDIGTTFEVRQYKNYSKLAVNEGEVKVTTANSQQSTHLIANQQVVFSKTAIQNIENLDNTYGAWSQGVLSVYKMPLPQFLDELGRYHRGHLQYDQAIQDIEVSGVFPIQNSETVLQALEQGLPIKVESKFYFWTKVSLQQKP